MATKLLLGRFGLGGLFRCALFNDTIVLRCTLHAITNLFTSWIVSHRGEIMPGSLVNGKEVQRFLLNTYRSSEKRPEKRNDGSM
jgi:hypothetical protein